MPRERVLLPQFGDCHSALNRSPLIIEHPGENDDEYMARLERAFEEVDARIRAARVALDAGYRHWPKDLRAELGISWEFMLDLGNYGRYESWQATVHCLNEEDVVEAVLGLSGGQRLTSKKPRIIAEINDNTGFCPSFLSESN